MAILQSPDGKNWAGRYGNAEKHGKTRFFLQKRSENIWLNPKLFVSLHRQTTTRGLQAKRSLYCVTSIFDLLIQAPREGPRLNKDISQLKAALALYKKRVEQAARKVNRRM